MCQHNFGAMYVRFDSADGRLNNQLHPDSCCKVEHDITLIDQLGREPLVHDRVDHVLESRTALEVKNVVNRAR